MKAQIAPYKYPRAIVFVEVPDATEHQQFNTRANLTLTWLHRNGAEPGTTDLLEKAIRGMTFPPGDGFAWAAGESSSMHAIREHLVNERGMHKSWVRVIGYWKRDTPDHEEDHD